MEDWLFKLIFVIILICGLIANVFIWYFVFKLFL